MLVRRMLRTLCKATLLALFLGSIQIGLEILFIGFNIH